MTTYYVSPTGSDSANGSSATPFLTIAHAVSVAVAGDTIVLKDGTYDQGSGLSISKNGAAGSPITIIAQNKWKALITSATSTSFAIQLAGDWWTLDGVEITNPLGNDGVQVWGSHCIVRNCHVHAIRQTSGNVGGGGIHVQRSSDWQNQFCIVENNLIHHCGPSTDNQTHGIYVSTQHHIIRNNIVHNIPGGYGIQGWRAFSDCDIINNTVFHITGSGGIIFGNGGDNPANFPKAANCRINNNIVKGVPNQFCAGVREFTGVDITTTVAQNNAVSGVFSPGFNYYKQDASFAYTGNVTSDPNFASYAPDGSGNYRLAKGSPCIGAGTSNGASTTDIDGVIRPTSTGYDIGAYQFNPIWAKF